MSDLAKCGKVVDIIPGRLVFMALSSANSYTKLKKKPQYVYYSVDDEYIYEPFASDFGPLNMGWTYRFCQKTQKLLQEASEQKKLLCFYCGPFAETKANAAVLAGSLHVLLLGKSANEACESVDQIGPFCPFRDASSGPQCYGLNVRSTIQGLAHARDAGLLDLKSFDLSDYEIHERVENGDSTWIVPGKLLAFSGPAAVSETFYGYQTKVPEDYWSYFKERQITAVVRLNRPLYETKRFTAAGFRHYELYFPDGSCPTEPIVDRFLSIAENEGAIAVHCKAGLGRTGVLICCYMMKHFCFSATAALGYIRICRPGSVIGPQQTFVIQQEARMHRLGAQMREAKIQSVAALRPGSDCLGAESFKNNTAKPRPQFDISCYAASGPAPASPIGLDKPKMEPCGPATPQPSRYSRISSFLRLKGLSIKGPSGTQAAATSVSPVARAVAPNGQPRKIPAALLAAGECGLKAYAADEDQPDSAKSDQWTINSCSIPDCRLAPFAPLSGGLQSGSKSIDMRDLL